MKIVKQETLHNIQYTFFYDNNNILHAIALWEDGYKFVAVIHADYESCYI